jgi:glycerophosphoryl diester phosphodiesterase
MNWETSKPLVIAHRGDTKAGVENTLAAVEAALRSEIDGVEVDLRLTQDGEIVLFHDEDLRRLAGADLQVEESPLARLREFRLKGAVIPTLAELLDLVGDRKLLNLEIKTFRWTGRRLEERLVDLLRTFRLNDSILISSFYPLPLRRLKRLTPSLKRGYLFKDKLFLHKQAMPFVNPFSIHAPLSHLSHPWLEAARKAGRRFFVWTVNGENDMKRCIDADVDGIITDEPQKLLKLLHGR